LNIIGNEKTFSHFCLFAGGGGLSYGLSKGHARVGTATARLRCIGGVDSDPYAVRDFTKLTGTKGTCLDLFDEYDYEKFHGQPPPMFWQKATAENILAAANGECPDILAMSPPCKGFSGLLNKKYAATEKYQALNNLTVRGLMLSLAAFKDDPPGLIIFENVPRIKSRGKDFLEVIDSTLRAHGYAVAHTTHDCGELGGLAQSRKRFLLVARHTSKVPPFLYEPPKRRLRTIGETLKEEPLPGSHSPMHVVPRLTRKTWIRLALIEAGKDWRSLRDLNVEAGVLTDYKLEPTPILNPSWDKSGEAEILRIIKRDGSHTTGINMGDPRPTGSREGNGRYRITGWNESSGCVLARSDTHQGACEIADPRWPSHINNKKNFANGGHYGVNPWGAISSTVTGRAKYDCGKFSIADPRWMNIQDEMMIISQDETWHRPLTTYELAILQGFPSDLELATNSHTRWRQRIGNAVPPPTAAAIGNEMALTLLLNNLGESYTLNSAPIWVKKLRRALGANI